MRPDVLAEHLATTIRGLVAPVSDRVMAIDGSGVGLFVWSGACSRDFALRRFENFRRVPSMYT